MKSVCFAAVYQSPGFRQCLDAEHSVVANTMVFKQAARELLRGAGAKTSL